MNLILFDILTCFRAQNVAVVGDIEKAFLNVEIDAADRDSLRFYGSRTSMIRRFRLL